MWLNLIGDGDTAGKKVKQESDSYSESHLAFLDFGTHTRQEAFGDLCPEIDNTQWLIEFY